MTPEEREKREKETLDKIKSPDEILTQEQVAANELAANQHLWKKRSAAMPDEQKHRFAQLAYARRQHWGQLDEKYGRDPTGVGGGTPWPKGVFEKARADDNGLRSIFLKPHERDGAFDDTLDLNGLSGGGNPYDDTPSIFGQQFDNDYADPFYAKVRKDFAAWQQQQQRPLPPTTPREQTELRRIFAADAPSRLGPPKRVVASPMAVAKIGGPYSLKAQPEMRREAAAKLAKITAVDLPDEGGQKAR